MTRNETMWTGRNVLITGGASFIGSALADQLIARGAKIRVYSGTPNCQNRKANSSASSSSFCVLVEPSPCPAS